MMSSYSSQRVSVRVLLSAAVHFLLLSSPFQVSTCHGNRKGMIRWSLPAALASLPWHCPLNPMHYPSPAAESQTTLHHIPLTGRKQEPTSLVSVYTHQCTSIYINMYLLRACTYMLHVHNILMCRVHMKTFGDRCWFRKTGCCTFSRSWVAVHCLAERCPSECFLVM